MLRDASRRSHPQHEVVVFQQVRPHPEEAAKWPSQKDGPQYRFVIPGTRIIRWQLVPQKPVRRPPCRCGSQSRARSGAAKAVFSAGGPDASLEAVARRAGVGIGTLYPRHFPTREALFEAV